MTFADFAVTEVRFRKHFRMAPPDTWNENMVPLAEFLELAPDEREGHVPLRLDGGPQAAAHPAARGQADGRVLRGPARLLDDAARARRRRHAKRPRARRSRQQVRREVVGRIASGLMQLAGGAGERRCRAWPRWPLPPRRRRPRRRRRRGGRATSWRPGSTRAECTSCDECIQAQPEDLRLQRRTRRPFIKDPNGGPYRDLVKAAEHCTAQVIHPGTAARPQREGHRQVDQAGREVQLAWAAADAAHEAARAQDLPARHPPAGVEGRDERAADPAVPVRAGADRAAGPAPRASPRVPVVREGQEVVRGQRIARADGFMSVSMHAPASGIVRRIGLAPSITGRMVPGGLPRAVPAARPRRWWTARPARSRPRRPTRSSRRSRTPASSASAAPPSRPTSS